MALQVGVLVQHHGFFLHRKSVAQPFGWRPVTATVDSADPRLMEAAARERTSELFGLETTILVGQFQREVGEHTWTVYGMEILEDAVAVEINPHVTEAYAWLNPSQMKNLACDTSRYMQGEILESEWVLNPGLEPGWCDVYMRLEPNMLAPSPLAVGAV
jgi:hypothetical protein